MLENELDSVMTVMSPLLDALTEPTHGCSYLSCQLDTHLTQHKAGTFTIVSETAQQVLRRKATLLCSPQNSKKISWLHGESGILTAEAVVLRTGERCKVIQITSSVYHFFRIPLKKLTNATFVASKLVFISPAMLLEGESLLQSGINEITCLNQVPGFICVPVHKL